jgi:hypothetical protein
MPSALSSESACAAVGLTGSATARRPSMVFSRAARRGVHPSPANS